MLKLAPTIALGLLVAGGCRARSEWPEQSPPPEPEVSVDFGTETTDEVTEEEAAWLAVATERDEPMRHDARLDALAEQVAGHAAAGSLPTHADVDRWAARLGTPYFPYIGLLAGDVTELDAQLDAWLDAMPGQGPIAFGLASGPGFAVVTGARAWFSLTESVPRSGGALAVVPLEGLEVELITATAERVDRIQPSVDEQAGVARFGSVSKALVEVSGRMPRRNESALVHTTGDETLGRLRFDGAPSWDPSPTLGKSVATVRAAMGQPPMTEIGDAHVRCEDPSPVVVDDRTVELNQSCMTLSVYGDPPERIGTVLGRASVLERIADPRWEIVEIDESDPGLLRLRFTREFRPREPSEVRHALASSIEQRWPQSKPTADLDTPLADILGRWSQSEDVVSTNPTYAEEVVALAKGWAPTPRYFQVLVAAQEPAKALEAIPEDVVPHHHAVAVTTGKGQRGEPLYLVSIVLATE